MAAEQKTETKKDIAIRLAMQGLTNNQIAERTGIKYGTVWAILKDFRKHQKECMGKNMDRHLCPTCKHRFAGAMARTLQANCNYIGPEGKKRPCKAEDCFVYEKGNPIKDKEEE